MAVYVDLVMLINGGVDLLLLAATDRLSGFPVEWKRVVPGAVLGGIYGGLCLFRELRFLSGIPWRIVFLMLISAVAFGCNRSMWKRCGVFILLTMTLGGIAMSIGRTDMMSLGFSCVGMWLLCAISVGDGLGKRRYVTMSVSHLDKTVSAIALIDSGNTLRDPVSGEQVLVVSARIAEQLTGLSRKELSRPIETLAANPGKGFRLIPYQAVGQGNGMLLGMRFPEVWIGERKRSAVIAFAAEGIGDQQIYQALVAAV